MTKEKKYERAAKDYVKRKKELKRKRRKRDYGEVSHENFHGKVLVHSVPSAGKSCKNLNRFLLAFMLSKNFERDFDAKSSSIDSDLVARETMKSSGGSSVGNGSDRKSNGEREADYPNGQ